MLSPTHSALGHSGPYLTQHPLSQPLWESAGTNSQDLDPDDLS